MQLSGPIFAVSAALSVIFTPISSSADVWQPDPSSSYSTGASGSAVYYPPSNTGTLLIYQTKSGDFFDSTLLRKIPSTTGTPVKTDTRRCTTFKSGVYVRTECY